MSVWVWEDADVIELVLVAREIVANTQPDTLHPLLERLREAASRFEIAEEA